MEYVNDNPTFLNTKVLEQLELWGGDIRYVDNNKNIYILKKENPLATHINVGNRPIKVGYDSNVSTEAKEQFDYTFKYFNELFEIINPNIKFETAYLDKDDCDIYVRISDTLEKNIGAQVEISYNKVNSSKVSNADVHYNKEYLGDNAKLKFYLAHELMHVLYGSNDVNCEESETFSLYNYDNMAYIISRMNILAEFGPTKDYINSFITLTPTDVSALIAIYGTPSIENQVKYKTLLENTEKTCKRTFGLMNYYKKGYKLPTTEELEK